MAIIIGVVVMGALGVGVAVVLVAVVVGGGVVVEVWVLDVIAVVMIVMIAVVGAMAAAVSGWGAHGVIKVSAAVVVSAIVVEV